MITIFHDWKQNLIWTGCIILVLWIVFGMAPGFFTLLLASLSTLGIRWLLSKKYLQDFKSTIDAEFERIRSRIKN